VLGRAHAFRLLILILALWPASVVAQTANGGLPGPYTVDLRGSTIGLPGGSGFFPVLPADTSVPARAFGLDIGADVYPFSLGVARVGVGGSVTVARGSIGASGVSTVVRAFAPQVSFNFGHRDGWSYLSAGYGTVSVRSEAPVGSISSSPPDGEVPVMTTTGGTADSGRLGAVNVGGGARWFVSDHLAVGFDVRFHRVAAGSAGTPATTLVGASVGVSIR
jgi:hypothetical protein